jgi:succinoglycan biosynthesis transport protein ExoP
VPQIQSLSEAEFSAAPTLADRIDLVIGFLRRQYFVILVCMLLSLTLGAVYYFTRPAVYTASATMMIETRKSPLQDSLGGNATPDPAWIDSQIGVLKSLNVAAYVVKQLRLSEDPEFTRSDVGLLSRIRAALGWKTSEPSSEAELVSQAITALNNGLDVRRLGLSYMMRIDFRSQNPVQAIKITNTMIDAYIFEALNAKYQANRRAGDWLQERLQSLREQAAAAERAVLEFKAKNNMVTAGGTLMNDKQLSEITGQLSTARARTADVQARLERIEAVRLAYQPDQPVSAVDETVSEAMNSGIITKYRTQYLDLMTREADWSVRYGKNHVAVVNLRNQIRDVRKSILDELGRIEETFRSEYEIAKKREDQLEKSLSTLLSQSTETNQAQIALFSLEAAAQSYRKIYDSFLQRHTESVQQQSFPIVDARPISPAAVSQTGPLAFQIWMTTIFAGGMLGVGFGLMREIMDRGFRTREQVRSVLATECLALVPLLTDERSKKSFYGRRSGAVPAKSLEFDTVNSDRASLRNIGTTKILQALNDAPSSLYAEAIRSIKLAVDLSSAGTYTKVIGLTSCVPSEGKTTLAAAMAMLIGQGGSRVLLVDCDLRNPSLSRTLTPDANVGFLEVVAGKVPLADAIWNDSSSNMAFLPMVHNPLFPNVTDILRSDAAKSLFDALQIKYDYVIVDLAPLVAALDVRAASHLLDSYVLVIEWGSTKIEAVQYALRNAPGVQEKFVGAVLNKVNMDVMTKYDNYGANYYYGQSRHAAH